MEISRTQPQTHTSLAVRMALQSNSTDVILLPRQNANILARERSFRTLATPAANKKSLTDDVRRRWCTSFYFSFSGDGYCGFVGRF